MIFMAVFGLSAGWLGLALGGNWNALTFFALVGLSWIAYGTFIAPKRLRVRVERKALAKEPKAWMKLVFMADLHAGGGKRQDWYEKLFSKIKDLSPDALLLGGDFVVADSGSLDALQGLGKLELPYGKYFVLGNHDYLDNPSEIKERLESWGLKDLTNIDCDLTYQGLKLLLSGADDSLFGKPKYSPRKSADLPRIILAHEPDLALDLKEGQVDLMLSGHTHGGQIRLPFVGSIVVPSKLGRRADEGWRVINGIHVFVTRGVGEVMCRARLFCAPEIVVLELGI